MQTEIYKKTVDLKNLKPAKRYSKALLECGTECGEIYKNLEFVSDTIENNPELKAFLDNPVISKQGKKDVISELFSGKISEHTLNFLSLLTDENRIDILADILVSLKNGINESENTLEAFITSAVELDEAQKETLTMNLENKTGKNILPQFKVDSGILGGIVVKINDTVIDFSLKKRIDNLNKIIER